MGKRRRFRNRGRRKGELRRIDKLLARPFMRTTFGEFLYSRMRRMSDAEAVVFDRLSNQTERCLALVDWERLRNAKMASDDYLFRHGDASVLPGRPPLGGVRYDIVIDEPSRDDPGDDDRG